jgi:hypothetical protein
MSKSNSKSTNYYISESNIQGKGVFTNRRYQQDEPIDIGIRKALGFFPVVTPYFGSLINHSWKPNTYLDYDTSTCNYVVKCRRPLKSNTEITLDYRATPWYIMGPNPTWD